jgi:hypothetical protein
LPIGGSEGTQVGDGRFDCLAAAQSDRIGDEQKAKKYQVSQPSVPEIGFSAVGGVTQSEILPID